MYFLWLDCCFLTQLNAFLTRFVYLPVVQILQEKSNDILTAVVQGMRKEETNMRVRLAATKALLNSLEFTRRNFENDQERHFIMQVCHMCARAGVCVCVCVCVCV